MTTADLTATELEQRLDALKRAKPPRRRNRWLPSPSPPNGAVSVRCSLHP